MPMNSSTNSALILGLIMACSVYKIANANFALTGPSEEASQTTEEITVREPTNGPKPARKLLATIPPLVIKGFGHNVPVAFASRQIVPAAIKVTYDSTVDADAVLVDWKGGRAWPDVLRAALVPAGLKPAFSPGAVRIKPDPRS